jgi:hypothetical protein
MVQRLALEEGHVELIRHERRTDMRGKRRVAGDPRQRARAAALVGDLESFADAQRKSRVVIEEEGGDVVVVDDDRSVGSLLLQPFPNRSEGSEDRAPAGSSLPCRSCANPMVGVWEQAIPPMMLAMRTCLSDQEAKQAANGRTGDRTALNRCT